MRTHQFSSAWRLARGALRIAAFRRPADVREEMTAEWEAELAAIAAGPGSAGRQAWRAVRFGMSLACARPDLDEAELAARSLPARTWRPALLALLTPVVGIVAAFIVYLAMSVATSLVWSSQYDPANQRNDLVSEMLAIATRTLVVVIMVAWLAAMGRWLGRRPGALPPVPDAATVPWTVLLLTAGVVMAESVMRLTGSSDHIDTVPGLIGLTLWAAIMLPVGYGMTALLRTGRRWSGAAVGYLGAYLAWAIPVTVAALIEHGADEFGNTARYAGIWHLTMVVDVTPLFGTGFANGAQDMTHIGAATAIVRDDYFFVPHLMIPVTAFALTYLAAATRRSHLADATALRLA